MNQLLLIFLILSSLSGQINWYNTFGDSLEADDGWAIDNTLDGGYILAGMAQYEATLIKIDNEGNEIWSQIYQKGVDDCLKSVKQTSDGGYIAAGYFSDSTSWDYVAWIIKTDASGTIQWDQSYSTNNRGNQAEDVIETSDGGFVYTGNRNNNGDNAKALLRKYSSDGTLLWSEQFSSSNYNEGISLIETSDNNLVFVGFSGTSHGAYKHFMVKTDANGIEIWKKRFGDNTQQSLNAVCEAPDGGYVATGYCNNYDNLYIVKYNIEGNQVWEKSYDASESDDWDTDHGNDIIAANNGGYYILGSTNVYPGSTGQDDYWLIKTNNMGDTLWTEIIGGNWWDIGQSILEIDNGDLVLFGWTYSYSTYPNNQYDNDFWLIHYTPTEMSLSENIIVQPQNFQLYDAYPNPFNPQTTIHYMLKNDTHLKIKIHDITGKKIKTIMDGIQKAGYHNYIWNSKNDMGQNVSNGIYFYSIETQLEQKTKKMILVR